LTCEGEVVKLANSGIYEFRHYGMELDSYGRKKEGRGF
jgi:hypothetical protein